MKFLFICDCTCLGRHTVDDDSWWAATWEGTESEVWGRPRKTSEIKAGFSAEKRTNYIRGRV
jgi:hypothetical protein